MSIEKLEFEAKIDLDAKGAEVTGEVSYAVEEKDTCVVVKAVFAADISILAFSREEVLTALYKYLGAAARVTGVYSDSVGKIEEDIENVKNGGELAPYAWLFEVE